MFIFSVIVTTIAIVLLVREWNNLIRSRREIDNELLYDNLTFVRRAMVSILLLMFIALLANQELYLTIVKTPTAKMAYLGYYVLIVASIYILAILDFRQSRLLLSKMEKMLAEKQSEYIRELVDAMSKETENNPQTPIPIVIDEHSGN